jgi:transposase InsO family protein
VQDLIQEVLQESHLNKQKLKISAIRRLIEARCRQVGLAVPAYNTVLTRVLQLSSCDRIKARIGAKEAREAATIHRGPFEEAEYPLAIVQIDHTPLDIILVDEAARLPIGRPWLTLAIDVYSRMVVGYCLTFDPPGAISVGLCLVHAILPKDAWLAKFGLKAEWPCWGVPTTIHADNGKDFRCESLQRACLEHRINIEWRPLRRANFGGHIERLLGTFLQEMHQLAGTTFSNVAERGNYDAVKTAAFTLREFECWLANLITGNYHQRPHGGLEGQCPLRRYEEGILGTPTQPGRGRPSQVRNERRLLLDFLPGVERSIQEYGVQIDRIIYFSDELRPHVQAVDPEHPFERRRHVFRRDPRDISVIYYAFQDDGRGNGCLPVFYISAPPVADEKRFYDAVLEAMDVRRTSSTVATAQANVIRIFRALGVRVLLIDEIQHLVAAGAIRSRQMMNVLKYMSNDLQIPIIGAGVQSAFNALQSDDQMANRFKPVVLPRWELNEEFLQLLASFELLLPLRKPSNLTDKDMAVKLYGMVGGKIGELATLLADAVVDAIRSGQECITPKTIRQLGWVSPDARKHAAEGLGEEIRTPFRPFLAPTSEISECSSPDGQAVFSIAF